MDRKKNKPAPTKTSEATHPESKQGRGKSAVPGTESSKAAGTQRDGRTANDKDGNSQQRAR